jgi:hypothetical protein
VAAGPARGGPPPQPGPSVRTSPAPADPPASTPRSRARSPALIDPSDPRARAGYSDQTGVTRPDGQVSVSSPCWLRPLVSLNREASGYVCI